MRPTHVTAGDPTRTVAADSSPWSTPDVASYPDPEELRDVCSLLSLADRVLLASPESDATAARLLSVVLEDLGFIAHVVNARTIHLVQPIDTVVAVCAEDVDPDFIDLLRPVLSARAVLIAVTVSRRSAILPLADAAITVAEPLGGWLAADGSPPRPGLDLRLIVAVDAIRRDLQGRRDTPL